MKKQDRVSKDVMTRKVYIQKNCRENCGGQGLLLRLALLLCLVVGGVKGAWGEITYKTFYYNASNNTGADTGHSETLKDGTVELGTLTYGTTTKTWEYRGDVSYTYDGHQYTGWMKGGSNVPAGLTISTGSISAIPTSGSFVKIAPVMRGEVTLVYRHSTDKNYGLLRVKDGAIDDFFYIGGTSITVTGTGETARTFNVEPGYEYYFFGKTTNPEIYGFAFKYETGRKYEFTNKTKFPNGTGTWDGGTFKVNGTGVNIGTGSFAGLAVQDNNTTVANEGLYHTGSGGRIYELLNLKKGDKVTINVTATGPSTGVTATNNFDETTTGTGTITYTVTNDGYAGFTLSRASGNGTGGTFYARVKSIEVQYASPSSYPVHYYSPSYKTFTFGTVEDFDIPALTDYRSTKTTPTLTSNNESVLKLLGNVPKITGKGTAIISSANDAIGGEAKFRAFVDALTAAAEKSNGNRTLTFTAPGLYENASETLDGLTLTFGDGTHPRVVVNKAGVGIGVKVLDGNGYYQKYPAGSITTAGEGTYVGTYYKLAATKSGALTVKGYLDNAKLVNGADGSEVTTTVADGTLTADLSAGNTYYLYNEQNGETLKALLLHELTFEPLAEVPVTFANANPTITVALADGTFFNKAQAGVTGATIATYTSNNTDVAEVNPTTGEVTLKAAGTAKITATSTAPAGYVAGKKSYTLTVVGPQKWVFASGLQEFSSWDISDASTNWDSQNVTVFDTKNNTWYYPKSKATDKDYSDLGVSRAAGVTFTNQNDRMRMMIAPNFGIRIMYKSDSSDKTALKIGAKNLTAGQIVSFYLKSASKTENFTLAWDNLTNLDGTSIASTINVSKDDWTICKFKVKENGTISLSQSTAPTTNNNWLLIGAIYVDKTPALPTGTMTYNAGNSLSLAGGQSGAPVMTVKVGDSEISLADNFDIDTSWSSSDVTVATVDGDGKVTPLKAGVTTITVKATAKDATKYQDVWFSTVVTVTNEVTSTEETIYIDKLLYTPSTAEQKTQGEDGHMDRTIPKFTLTMTGKDALRYNTEGKLVMKKYTQSNGDVSLGTIVIKPRYTGSTKIVFTGVELEVRGATNGTDQFTVNDVSSGAMATADAKYAVELTGDAKKDELEIKYSTTSTDPETAGFQIVAIKLSYQTADGASFLTDVLDETKVSPSAMSFNSTTINVAVGAPFCNGLTFTLPVSEDATPATTTLFAPTGRVSYTSSDTGVATIGSDGTGQLIADGTSTITATLTFEDDDYFTGTLSDTYTVGRDALAAVAGIDVAQLLIADNVNTNTSNAPHFTKRVIPRFTLDFAGGDGCKANQSGGVRFVELRKETGIITITPRKKAGVAGTLKIAGYQLQYQDSPTAIFTVTEKNGGATTSTDVAVDGEWHATDCETLTLKHKTGDGVQLTGIRLIYRLVDGDGTITDVEDAVVTDKTPLRLDVDVPVIELAEVGNASATVTVTTQSYGSASDYEAYRLDIVPTYAAPGVATIADFTASASKATGATVTATGVGSTSIKLGLAANDYFDVTPANIAVQVGGNRRQEGQLWNFTTMDTDTFWGIKSTGIASGGYWKYMESFIDPNYQDKEGREDDAPYTNYYCFTQTNASAVPLKLNASTSISYTEGLTFVKNNASDNRIIGVWTNSDGVNTLLMLNTSMYVPVTNFQKVDISVSRTSVNNAAFTLPNATTSTTDLTIRSTTPVTYVLTPNVGVSSVQLNFASRATQVYQVRTYDARLAITPTLSYTTEAIEPDGTATATLSVVTENGVTLTAEQVAACFDVTYYTESTLISVDPATGTVTNTSGKIGSPDVSVVLTPKAQAYYFMSKGSAYVNLLGTLPAGESTTITASAGQTVKVITKNEGTAQLTNCKDTDTHTFTEAESYTWTTTATTTGNVTLTNTGSSDLQVVLFRAFPAAPVVEFSYNDLIGDRILFVNEQKMPKVSIKDGAGNDISSLYTTTYEFVRNDCGASINASTGQLITGTTKGLVRVLLTGRSSSAAYEDIEKTFDVYVVDGVWNIAADYTTAYGNILDDTQWSSRTSNEDRNKKDYTYIMTADGELITPTFGLQVKGFMSLYGSGTPHIHLFGNKTADDNEPATIKIPVRANQIIKFKAYTMNQSGDDVPFSLTNVKDANGEVTEYWLAQEGVAEEPEFVCINDGFVTITNNNQALQIAIDYINLFNQIKFTATEDYVMKDVIQLETGYYVNPILNGAPSEFTYEITEGESTVVKTENLTGEGHITQFEGYGTVVIKATSKATEGVLAGLNATYTLHVVDMEIVKNTLTAMLNNATLDIEDTDDNPDIRTDLKQNVKIKSTGDFYDEALKAKVQFSMLNCTKPSTYAHVVKEDGKYVLHADGLGEITIQAELGQVKKTFDYIVGGTEFATMNPVIASIVENYQLDIVVEKGTIKMVSEWETGGFKIDYDHIYGNIDKSAAMLKLETVTGEATSIKLTGIAANPDWVNTDNAIPSSKGGVIPVIAKVKFLADGKDNIEANWVERQITTLITVAYSQNVWNFQDELSPLTNIFTPTAAYPTGSTYVGEKNAYWQVQKKLYSPSNNTAYVFSYLPEVNKTNAAIIGQTAGLQIESEDNLGTNLDKKELLIKNGCRIIIPQVMPGQQIDVYWLRHTDDKGERLKMENLLDVAGKPIDELYKISWNGNNGNGNTYSHTDRGGTGSYSFIVADANGDGSAVDAVIECADAVWVRIDEIVLHSPEYNNGEYFSTMEPLLKLSTGENASNVYVTKGVKSSNVTFGGPSVQNAVHAAGTNRWTVEKMDGNAVYDLTIDKTNNRPILNYTSGWGKVKLTLASLTQDKAYVASQRSWVLTFGQAPTQDYPKTWDLTRSFTTTPTELNDNSRTGHTWTSTANNGYQAVTTDYDTYHYESYFVDNAELVDEVSKKVIPETEGLGFSISDKSAGSLKVLEDTPAPAPSRRRAPANPNHTDDKHGALTSATIIIPGENLTTNHLIYVKSDPVLKDTEVLDADDNKLDALPTGNDGYKVNGDGLVAGFKVKTAGKDVKLTFSGHKVYQIGVTDITKPMTKVGTEGWATESREQTIDHTLTGYFTKNDVKAYIVKTASYDPATGDGTKKSVTVGLTEAYVVPERHGIVLKQEGVTDSYTVPLFVPAITTAVDDESDYSGNLMMAHPNIRQTANESLYSQGATLGTEQENVDGTDNASGDYVRFILATRYMTWAKPDGGSVVAPKKFEEGDKPVFYRLHVYKDVTDVDTKGETVAQLNTLGDHKAYLHIAKSLVPDALWDGTTAPSRGYIGIRGVSDMDEWEDTPTVPETDAEGRLVDDGGTVYNLQGQAVQTLVKGRVYVRGGRKIVAK